MLCPGSKPGHHKALVHMCPPPLIIQEGECFARAASLDTHKALVHIFFAQRSTKKVKGITDAGKEEEEGGGRRKAKNEGQGDHRQEGHQECQGTEGQGNKSNLS